MPNKSSKSIGERLYFAGIIAVGSAIAVKSIAEVASTAPRLEWLVLGILTLVTGSFTIKIPRLSIRMSVSDAFVFASVLSFGTFGTPVATVIVAIDSVVATLWMRRENRSVFRSVFNLSVASLSIWIASSIFHWSVGPDPDLQRFSPGLLGSLFLLAALYFLFNTWMVAGALAFEQGIHVFRLWWKHFPWFSLNYFGGVSAGALLVSYTKDLNLGAISIILPLLLISYLTYRTSLGRVQDAQRHLDQMNELYMSTIEALAMAVDAKDQITHGHIRRVQVYAVELAKRLGVIESHQLDAIETAALLHDMGKLAIPEHILNKPGKLTDAEFEKMKRHADIGADLLSSIKFPYPVVPIVRHHHENWNGMGYPARIGGTDIPLGARILAVVDCFDALTSDRPYRPRLTNEDAFKILRDRRGTMYDPLIVDTFIRVHDEIAPSAIQAGHDARSMMPLDVDQPGRDHDTPLNHIRSTAFESSVIAQLERRLESATSWQDTLATIGEHLRKLTSATLYALYRYDIETDTLVCTESIGDDRSILSGHRIHMGEKITGWTAANKRTSLNSNAYLDLGPLSEIPRPPFRSTASTPLVHQDRVIAVLTAYSPHNEGFKESHRYVLEHVAELAVPYLLTQDAQQGSGVIAFPSAS